MSLNTPKDGLNSNSFVVQTKSAVKVKGKGQSVMSTVSSFVLKRIKGTQTWQRMQIRKNTAANKEIVEELKFAEYQKPVCKLNASSMSTSMPSSPIAESDYSSDIDCESTGSHSPTRRKTVNFIPLVKQITYTTLLESSEEIEAARQKHDKVLELLGLPALEDPRHEAGIPTPPSSDTAVSGSSTPTAAASGWPRISFLPLRLSSTAEDEASGAAADAEERPPLTPYPRGSLADALDAGGEGGPPADESAGIARADSEPPRLPAGGGVWGEGGAKAAGGGAGGSPAGVAMGYLGDEVDVPNPGPRAVGACPRPGGGSGPGPDSLAHP